MIAIEENNSTFDDCYNIFPHGHNKFYFKCDKCGNISNNKKDLYNNFKCEYCSDGISLPNKWIRSMLKMLDIDFISEYTPCYFRKSQSVDIFIPSMNIIIEMDGNYGNHTKEYDYWRDFLNMKYGGYKTIRIDLTDGYLYRNNPYEYLMTQTKKLLNSYFNLSSLNWDKLWLECQVSKCVSSWELWNGGIHSTLEISRLLDICQSTVIRYLKRGKKYGKCDYPQNNF